MRPMNSKPFRLLPAFILAAVCSAASAYGQQGVSVGGEPDALQAYLEKGCQPKEPSAQEPQAATRQAECGRLAAAARPVVLERLEALFNESPEKFEEAFEKCGHLLGEKDRERFKGLLRTRKEKASAAIDTVSDSVAEGLASIDGILKDSVAGLAGPSGGNWLFDRSANANDPAVPLVLLAPLQPKGGKTSAYNTLKTVPPPPIAIAKGKAPASADKAASFRVVDGLTAEALDQDGNRLGLTADTRALFAAQGGGRAKPARELADSVVKAMGIKDPQGARSTALAAWLQSGIGPERGATGMRLSVNKNWDINASYTMKDGRRRVETAVFGRATPFKGERGESVASETDALVVALPTELDAKGRGAKSLLRWKEYLPDGRVLSWSETRGVEVPPVWKIWGAQKNTSETVLTLRGVSGRELDRQVKTTSSEEVAGTSEMGKAGAGFLSYPIIGPVVGTGLKVLGATGEALTGAPGIAQGLIGHAVDSPKFRVEGSAGTGRLLGADEKTMARRYANMDPEEKAIVNHKVFEQRSRALRDLKERFVRPGDWAAQVDAPVSAQDAGRALVGSGPGTYGTLMGEWADDASGWGSAFWGTASAAMHFGEAATATLPTLGAFHAAGGLAKITVPAEAVGKAATAQRVALASARTVNTYAQVSAMGSWAEAIPQNAEHLWDALQRSKPSAIAEAGAHVINDLLAIGDTGRGLWKSLSSKAPPEQAGAVPQPAPGGPVADAQGAKGGAMTLRERIAAAKAAREKAAREAEFNESSPAQNKLAAVQTVLAAILKDPEGRYAKEVSRLLEKDGTPWLLGDSDGAATTKKLLAALENPDIAWKFAEFGKGEGLAYAESPADGRGGLVPGDGRKARLVLSKALMDLPSTEVAEIVLHELSHIALNAKETEAFARQSAGRGARADLLKAGGLDVNLRPLDAPAAEAGAPVSEPAQRRLDASASYGKVMDDAQAALSRGGLAGLSAFLLESGRYKLAEVLPPFPEPVSAPKPGAAPKPLELLDGAYVPGKGFDPAAFELLVDARRRATVLSLQLKSLENRQLEIGDAARALKKERDALKKADPSNPKIKELNRRLKPRERDLAKLKDEVAELYGGELPKSHEDIRRLEDAAGVEKPFAGPNERLRGLPKAEQKLALETEAAAQRVPGDFTYIVGDVHLSPDPAAASNVRWQETVKKIKNDKPGYVLIMGDVLDAPLSRALEPAKKLEVYRKAVRDVAEAMGLTPEEVKGRIQFVTGNHDVPRAEGGAEAYVPQTPDGVGKGTKGQATQYTKEGVSALVEVLEAEGVKVLTRHPLEFSRVPAPGAVPVHEGGPVPTIIVGHDVPVTGRNMDHVLEKRRGELPATDAPALRFKETELFVDVAGVFADRHRPYSHEGPLFGPNGEVYGGKRLVVASAGTFGDGRNPHMPPSLLMVNFSPSGNGQFYHMDVRTGEYFLPEQAPYRVPSLDFTRRAPELIPLDGLGSVFDGSAPGPGKLVK